MSKQPQPRPGLRLPVVDFLDTSVFVEVLDIPYMNDHRVGILAEMDRRLGAGVRFVRYPRGPGAVGRRGGGRMPV